MQWLRSAILKWLTHSGTEPQWSPNSPSVDYNETISSSNGRVSFYVYPATGGIVIETRRYDSKKDDMVGALYVVPTDRQNELGDILSNIVMVEGVMR